MDTWKGTAKPFEPLTRVRSCNYEYKSSTKHQVTKIEVAWLKVEHEFLLGEPIIPLSGKRPQFQPRCLRNIFSFGWAPASTRSLPFAWSPSATWRFISPALVRVSCSADVGIGRTDVEWILLLWTKIRQTIQDLNATTARSYIVRPSPDYVFASNIPFQGHAREISCLICGKETCLHYLDLLSFSPAPDQ